MKQRQQRARERIWLRGPAGCNLHLGHRPPGEPVGRRLRDCQLAMAPNMIT